MKKILHHTADNAQRATLGSYAVGFVLSALLTSAAFLIAWIHVSSGHAAISHGMLVSILLILAGAQLFVQLIFFMHLADESGPRWKLAAFISTVLIVCIIVIGSLWIMDHLNYNMMASPSEMNSYIQSQDGF